MAKHGGKREGAGRKCGVKTAVIRVPVSHKDLLKKISNMMLEQQSAQRYIVEMIKQR